MTKNLKALEYARRFIGTPYIYGGNGPYFDCSGLVCEVLKAVGVLKYSDDLSAADLFKRFEERSCSPVPGALAFFGKGGVDHVALIADERTMIEAGGGDGTTKTPEEAQRRGAMVRERPIASRAHLIGFYLPEYPIDGQ